MICSGYFYNSMIITSEELRDDLRPLNEWETRLKVCFNPDSLM